MWWDRERGEERRVEGELKKKKPDGWEREEESDEDLHARTVDRSSRRMDGLMLVCYYYYYYLFLFLEVTLALSIIWSVSLSAQHLLLCMCLCTLILPELEQQTLTDSPSHCNYSMQLKCTAECLSIAIYQNVKKRLFQFHITS